MDLPARDAPLVDRQIATDQAERRVASHPAKLDQRLQCAPQIDTRQAAVAHGEAPRAGKRLAPFGAERAEQLQVKLAHSGELAAGCRRSCKELANVNIARFQVAGEALGNLRVVGARGDLEGAAVERERDRPEFDAVGEQADFSGGVVGGVGLPVEALGGQAALGHQFALSCVRRVAGRRPLRRRLRS